MLAVWLAVVLIESSASRYLPSTLSVYELDSEEVNVQSQSGGPPVNYDYRLISPLSDDIANQVMQVARELEIRYLDFRATARTVARNTLIHGPRDWRHFNRTGYTLLGEAVAEKLAELGISCASDGAAEGEK